MAVKEVGGHKEYLAVLTDLHVRYIPKARLERWWGNDMSLPNSPHIELIQYYKNHGINWDVLLKSRYAEERRARRVEFKQEKWSEEWIKKHIEHRIDIYNSLKNAGFIHQGKPIQILSEPFWNTRFGLALPNITGEEIWNGAGRCAAAYVLGWKDIPATKVRDLRPNSNRCESIERNYPK